ncbi:MAG: sigma-54 dependent transcriptional regulator [Candidatus Sulfobium sp.]
MSSKGDVLVVDDEPNAIKVLSSILRQDGYAVHGTSDAESATRLIHRVNVDAIITDMRMPGKDGMELFGYVKDNYPQIPVIFLTAYGTVESAISALQKGAYYYFVKPPDYVQLKATLAKAIQDRRLKREIETREDPSNGGDGCRIIAETPQMLEIFRTMGAVKNSESSVLVCGETGTGKELVARWLHYKSVRRDKPFVAVNCAAIPKELMESELCGHERGAFTGAHTRRIGRIEEASGGTLFLDEIGELDLPLQAKLLRVLQEKEIVRLGSNKTIKVEFRLLCSTNRDLRTEIEKKSFREDLFYRINVITVQLPPLRERREDIPLLVEEFLREFSVREKKSLGASDETMSALYEYPWPGNVRQLRNIIERAAVLAGDGNITPAELPKEVSPRAEMRQKAGPRTTLKEMELQAIRDALTQYNGNKSKVAKVLGISRKALYKRLNGQTI